MPKKTRKDKIMAERRRQRQSVTSPQTSALQHASPTSPTYTFVSPADKKMQQTIAERSVELVSIQRDLLKTIILAALAFGVELYIYWLLKN